MSNHITQLTTALEGRYRIERELGEGGMAEVYLAEDLRHHRKVALKVLKPELAALVGAERFLTEIETTAGLQHPHILPLFDSGEAGGSVFYVMPYVEGESLRDRLDRETQLPVTEAVELARKVADALDYAHGRGVIHRDIKPANIMLSERGDPLVADFGIALAVSQAGGGRLTETGLSLGTPHYMSPEQASAERQVDARSDVYSLGAMLYEMLAGAPPFTAALAQAVLAKILTDEAPPVSEHRKTVPAHVAAAVTRSLEKLPADRFGSAAEFQAALGDTHFVYPSRAPGASSAGATDSFPGGAIRPAWGRRLVTGGVILVLAIAAAWGWSRRLPRQVSRYSVMLPEGRSFSGIIGSHLAIAPDFSAFVFSLDAFGQDQLWLRRRDELVATALPGTEGARNPTYSPDGARLAFSSFSGGIHVIPVTGGPSIPVAESADKTVLDPAGGHAWGADGYIYAVGQGGLVRVSQDGGTFEPVTTLDAARGEASHRFPHALPNGRGVLFTVTYRGRGRNSVIDNDIAVVDLASGQHVLLFGGVRALYAHTGHILYVTAAGALLAAPFDDAELRPSGEGIVLERDIEVRPSGWTDLALSSNGTLAYNTGTDRPSSDLVWVGRDGRETRIDLQWPESFEYVALSPDETRVAVGGHPVSSLGSDIWESRLEGGIPQQRTFDGIVNQRPVWTADGLDLIYSSDRERIGDLWQIPADGGGEPQLLLRRDRRIADGFLSRDGSWLIYRTSAAEAVGAGDILAWPMGGDTVPRALLEGPSGEFAPALSPDGRYLAYVSDRTGRSEVYVRRFLDTGVAPWRISNGGGQEPVWAKNGRELFYRDGAGMMVAIEVQTEPVFAPGGRQDLFDASEYALDPRYHSYAVTSDGQRFLMIRSSASEWDRAFIVVENFAEELTARVGS